jgi:hypothetical protein
MEYHRPALIRESATKWRLEVARRRPKKTSWRAAKVTFVAIRRVGVGPGVKMLDHSSSMKEAMVVVVVITTVEDRGREGVRSDVVRKLKSAGGFGEWTPRRGCKSKSRFKAKQSERREIGGSTRRGRAGRSPEVWPVYPVGDVIRSD